MGTISVCICVCVCVCACACVYVYLSNIRLLPASDSMSWEWIFRGPPRTLYLCQGLGRGLVFFASCC